jgi:hypothetical protein
MNALTPTRIQTFATPTPARVWRVWCSLIDDLVIRGFNKTLISQLSNLTPSAGKGRSVSRYVLYPSDEPWQNRGQGEHAHHHCSTCAHPAESGLVAARLIGAMMSLSDSEVEADHPAIAWLASDALDQLTLL